MSLSGGRIAIAGFDYQAIVILDQLFDHFDAHGPRGRARPEGRDDLDLVWSENGRDRHRHVQVKKPRETGQGILKNQPWRLSEVADELLPNTLDQLAQADSQQVWILGDAVQAPVRSLVQAGEQAASREPALYWSVVHRMARAAILNQLPNAERQALLKWTFKHPPTGPNDARDLLMAAYGQLLAGASAGAGVVQAYQQQVVWVHQRLPSVLARIEILDDYGSEATVGQRFKDRLQNEYRLTSDVVEHNLFGNFRSFINDVAKRPGEMIDRTGFEVQLRSAWPQMSPATEPPVLTGKTILRPDLIDELVKPGTPKVVEVVGISGSGKTTLAAQAAAALQDFDPDRLPIYVRVRADAAFRDVMAGVAFHLLRRGMPELFGFAVEARSADETAINRLADLCSGLSRPVQLLLDLAEGVCSDQFGRDLSRFVRVLPEGSCRLVVFGQQSSFSTLSPVESDSAGIRPIDIRGFHWEEFASLVSHYHADPDRAVLWDVFNRVTAGRPAGLYAQLAEALARQPTLDAMLVVSRRPPEDMVSAAEQARFELLSPAARAAAERLVCFALPFRREDAQRAFADQNVGGAIKALCDLGLLRIESDGLFEMHETVRAGLEAGIALDVRQSAHSVLADWYGQQGDIAAQIFHLGKADKGSEADSLARSAFLRGESWRSLSNYVTRRGLVGFQDMVEVAARPERIADFYLLRSLLTALASQDSVPLLVDLLEQQRSRYFLDHDWARPLVETILAVDPAQFQSLLDFTVTKAANADERRTGLTWLSIAVRHSPGASMTQVAGYARFQPLEVQRQLLPLLLLSGDRSALALAFEIYARPVADDARREAAWGGIRLKIERREDVVEILWALPQAKASAMIASRSLGFGHVGALLWAARHQLRPFCADILQDEGAEAEIRIAAWRVLIFVGHPAIGSLADPLTPGPVPQDFALLGPTFAPMAYDAGRYEQILLDPTAPTAQRQTAFTVLVVLDADIGSLRDRLAGLSRDPLAALWDQLSVLLFAKQPFRSGIPGLRVQLAPSSTNSMPSQLLVSCVVAVAEKAWPEVTELLLQAVQHTDASVRSAAVAGLARRRSKSAAEALRRQMGIESDAKVSVLLAQALAACGPQSANDLADGPVTPDLSLWRCIVAMRTRDETFAPQLVRLATDPSVHWRIRRAAIWAAGRLPFNMALEMIAPAVLAERTPLTIDSNDNLHAHASLTGMLENGVAGFLSDGEAKFVALVEPALRQQWAGLLQGSGLPAPSEAARWLYRNLMRDPSMPGVQELLNRLQTPLLQSAVIRALRISGRGEEIETALVQASSVWLAIKCLQERRWIRDVDPNLCSRLRRALAQSPCGDAAVLSRIVNEIEEGRRSTAPTDAAPSPASPAPAQPPSHLVLDFTSAMRVLRGASPLEGDATAPVVLDRLDKDQLQKLIALADPANDRPTSVVRFAPAMTFTPDGHVVGRESSTSTGGVSAPERLRPAIAAANRFDLPMPWHEDRLLWPWIGSYAPLFIASLGAQRDADRLYQALEAHADVLLPVLGSFNGVKATELLLDERLSPILHRYLLLGDDVFFESLCSLSQRIDGPSAVPVLSGLLARWASRFDLTSPALQGDSTELWRGFARLKDHARFREIVGWRKTLEDVLPAAMQWFHRQSIVRVLEDDPGSYVTVESRLSREENWVHFNRCEIDSLDEAASRLFLETSL